MAVPVPVLVMAAMRSAALPFSIVPANVVLVLLPPMVKVVVPAALLGPRSTPLPVIAPSATAPPLRAVSVPEDVEGRRQAHRCSARLRANRSMLPASTRTVPSMLANCWLAPAALTLVCPPMSSVLVASPLTAPLKPWPSCTEVSVAVAPVARASALFGKIVVVGLAML